MILPGGFSPLNAIKQVGSIVNPTGGVTDYNVFSQSGNTRSTPNGGYSTGATWQPAQLDGAMYYDGNNVQQYSNGQWSNVSQPTGGNDGGAVLGSGTTTAQQSFADQQAAAARAAQVSQFDQAINQYNGQLDRLPGQLDIALGNIGKQYGIRDNELTSGFNAAQGQYNNSTTQNQQQFRTNKNQIQDGASAGLRGLQRMLGAWGAGGTDQRLASNAVSTDAARQAAGASQTYGQNQQNLDTNWGNFKTQDKNEHQKLTDWRTEQENSARAQSGTNKQNILSKLAELSASRASALGGDAAASAQPYLDQISGLQGSIDQLGAINPTYTGNSPVYAAPTLGSYQVQQNSGQMPQNALDSSTTPFLSLLMGNKRKNSQYGF